MTNRHQDYRRTKKGLIRNIFLNQKGRSKRDKTKKLSYTFEELFSKLIYNDFFIKLYDNWKISGYNKDLTPSLDRIDDYKGYSFDNIQLMTWKENEYKGNLYRKIGLNNKKSKAIIQYSIDGKYIAEYFSIAHASRMLNVSRKGISNCCNNKTKTSARFKWKFKK